MLEVKSFNTAVEESTCQKRKVICEIYDDKGNLLARESNRCNPEGGICHRLGVVQDKTNYDTESSCNWVHAEINAINALPIGSKPKTAYLYGHTFFCSACEEKLKEVGVEDFNLVR